MARHFLIDGYNLLYALPIMPVGDWQAKRQTFLSLLKKQRPQGNNRATVVFDGQEGGFGKDSRSDLEVVFTSGETADDWISRKVRETSNPRAMTVVTDDQGLRQMIRGTGAKWMGCMEFWKAGNKEGLAKKAEDSYFEQDITNEFEKKWLK